VANDCTNITHYLVIISNGLTVVFNASTYLKRLTAYNLVSNTTYTVKVVAVSIAGPGICATFNVTTISQDKGRFCYMLQCYYTLQ